MKSTSKSRGGVDSREVARAFRLFRLDFTSRVEGLAG